MVSEKQRQYSSTASVVSNLGRPPRPQSTAPSIPKSMKENTESYPDVDIKDDCLWQEGTRDNCKTATMCNAGRNHTSMTDAFERDSATSVEDIYEDLQDVRPPNVICPSAFPISGMTTRCSIHCRLLLL
jgi:hypothetical protein